MRIDTVRTYDITRYQLVDGGNHLLTFDNLADLQAFAEMATQAVELAEYALEVDRHRVAAGEELHDANTAAMEVETFFLRYDNGSGYFDCASKHDDLNSAIEAAKSGGETRQRISTDAAGNCVVWQNY